MTPKDTPAPAGVQHENTPDQEPDMVPAAGKSAARPSEAERIESLVGEGEPLPKQTERPEGVVSDPDRPLKP